LYSKGQAYLNNVAIPGQDHAFRVFVDLELDAPPNTDLVVSPTTGKMRPGSPAYYISDTQVVCRIAANRGSVQYPMAMIRVSNDGFTTSKGYVPFAYSVCISGTAAEADAKYTPGVTTSLTIGPAASAAIGQSFTPLQTGELVRIDMHVTALNGGRAYLQIGKGNLTANSTRLVQEETSFSQGTNELYAFFLNKAILVEVSQSPHKLYYYTILYIICYTVL